MARAQKALLPRAHQYHRRSVGNATRG